MVVTPDVDGTGMSPIDVGSLHQMRVAWTVEAGSPVARLRGGIDASAAHDLEAIGDVADGSPGLTIDLHEVTFVDVNGLDLLEALAVRSNVTLRDLPGVVARVLARTAGIVDWPVLRRHF
jgi:anti-anti-sigma regulatory factor